MFYHYYYLFFFLLYLSIVSVGTTKKKRIMNNNNNWLRDLVTTSSSSSSSSSSIIDSDNNQQLEILQNHYDICYYGKFRTDNNSNYKKIIPGWYTKESKFYNILDNKSSEYYGPDGAVQALDEKLRYFKKSQQHHDDDDDRARIILSSTSTLLTENEQQQQQATIPIPIPIPIPIRIRSIKISNNYAEVQWSVLRSTTNENHPTIMGSDYFTFDNNNDNNVTIKQQTTVAIPVDVT